MVLKVSEVEYANLEVAQLSKDKNHLIASCQAVPSSMLRQHSAASWVSSGPEAIPQAV